MLCNNVIRWKIQSKNLRGLYRIKQAGSYLVNNLFSKDWKKPHTWPSLILNLKTEGIIRKTLSAGYRQGNVKTIEQLPNLWTQKPLLAITQSVSTCTQKIKLGGPDWMAELCLKLLLSCFNCKWHCISQYNS